MAMERRVHLVARQLGGIMKVTKGSTSVRFGRRGLVAGSLNVVLAALVAQGLAVAAQAATFTIRDGNCPGGVCEGTSAEAACDLYAKARISFSQNNPNDHNKWVSSHDLKAVMPGEPDGQSCMAGSCSFKLRAEAG
jgi:hypothetical protein